MNLRQQVKAGAYGLNGESCTGATGKEFVVENITVKRIEAGELEPLDYFRLKYEYKTELSQFVLFYDKKAGVLFVRKDIPEADVQHFVRVIQYEGKYINNPDSAVAGILDGIFEKYGAQVYLILIGAYQERCDSLRRVEAKNQAINIGKMIEQMEADEFPDGFDEYLAYYVWARGEATKKRTAYNMVGYGMRYVFALGYLMGSGKLADLLKRRCRDED